MNSLYIVGNLTRDPEYRQTSKGTSVLTFTVATNEKYKKKGSMHNEEETYTEFHRVVVWGAYADAMHDRLSKGQRVFVHGRMQTRSWEKPDGNKAYLTECVAKEVVQCGDGPIKKQTKEAKISENFSPDFDSDEEIPF